MGLDGVVVYIQTLCVGLDGVVVYILCGSRWCCSITFCVGPDMVYVV